jgi:type IV pilus assembly protein PilQ
MKKLLLGAGVATLLSITLYAAGSPNYKTLDQINVNGNTIAVTLSGKTKYHAFKISNPPRLVVEFSNTEFNAPQKELSVDSSLIRRIRGGQFKNEPLKTARIVVDLKRTADYEIRSTGDQVQVSLFDGSEAPSSRQNTADKISPVTSAASKPAMASITGTAAKSSEPGAENASALASTTDTSPIVQAIPEEHSSKEISFSAKKSAVKTEDETSLASAAAETMSTAYREDSEEAQKKTPQPKTAAVIERGGEQSVGKSSATVSSGVVLPVKPITFDFEEADIRDVLRILSMKSGINIIYGSDVSGTLTLRLENVPFNQAFATILSLKGLVTQEQGPNILRIVTPQKVSEERSQAVTFTKIFPLNYAKADEIKGNLDSIRSAEGRRGNISFDARTNSLIVTDTPEGLASIERIIGDLDKKPAQVIIEAKIVEVVVANSFDLGIQWQYAGNVARSANQQISIGATKAETSNNAMGSNASVGGTVVSPLSVGNGGTGVSFPATAINGQMASFAFGIVSNETRLTGILNALAQKGLSKLLSSPKVTTINNKEARILIGQRIPYTTTTVTNSGSTQATNFLDVGVKLTVTPTINIDQKITLQVHPEVSLYIRADAAGPVIGTREAQTTVIVNSGETVVIGGLITDEDRKTGTMVPLLGDLPVIGHLFKRDFKTKDRTELLVFLTPLIIE